MPSRLATTLSFAFLLLSSPTSASQPAGLAGKLIANKELFIGSCAVTSFNWVQPFSSRTLDPADTLTLDFAVIPFQSGQMGVHINAVGTVAFIEFEDGLVNGLRYDRMQWNDVTMVLRPATQDYMLSVNGNLGGPFPFYSACQLAGGCFSVSSIQVFRGNGNGEDVAWMDSILLWKDSVAGREYLVNETFASCLTPRVSAGGILLSTHK